MKYLLQQYDNGMFGYKGIDDCRNNNMLYSKGIGEDCQILAEQAKDESREDFIQRVGIQFKTNQYGSNEKLDYRVNDEDRDVRMRIAGQGYGLDKLINDTGVAVQLAVARQGYCLDKFINAGDPSFRIIVVEQGYGLDKLVDDPNEKVRKAVAREGYRLDKLINDKSWEVRAAVAEQGYGLDKLINDEINLVRRAAYVYIISNNRIKEFIPDISKETSKEFIHVFASRVRDATILMQLNINNIHDKEDVDNYFCNIYNDLDSIKNNDEYINKLKDYIARSIQKFGTNSNFMYWVNKIAEKLNWEISINIS